MKAASRLLLKVALEGKTFQEAREELHTEDTRGASAPAPDTVNLSPASLDLVEVRVLRADVHLQREGRALDASLTSVTAVAIHARGARPAEKPKDPLVLDLTGEGPLTTGEAGARPFDLAADGDGRNTSFVQGGTAFLALDRDGNGRIDSGAELFGDQHGAADGYAELAKFDANRDGRIDAADAIFPELRLLFGDGRVEPLAGSGVESLDLHASALEGSTSGGDAIFAEGLARRADGGRISTYALGLNRFDLQA